MSSPSAPSRRAPSLVRVLIEIAVVFIGIPWLAFSIDGGAPVMWTLLAWGTYLVVSAYRLRRRGAFGPLALTLGVALLVLGGFEGYRWRRAADRPQYVGTEWEELAGPHPDLGFAPIANAQGRVHLVHGDRTIFDVTYHHDAAGLRVVPTVPEEPAEGAVLLFGGSFMYGAGLEDDEAIPYRLGERLRERRIRAYNFAYGGWGPHQMLRGLETDWPSRVRESVKAAVYLCIPDHVRRVKGWSAWDPHGPRYLVAEDGTPKLAGRFSDGSWSSPARLRSSLARFHTARLLLSKLRVAEKDPALLVAIVKASASRVQDLWPGASFHVLLWDEGSGWTEDLGRQLDATGIPTHRISAFEAGFYERPDLRIPGDVHPSATTTDFLAAQVMDRVLVPALR